MRWMCAVIIEWSVIFLMFYLASISYYFWPLAIFIIGTRQHAISILGHDGAHWLICKNKKLNDILTKIFSFIPLGVGLTGYRKFHFSHHQLVGTPQDPEKDLYEGWSKKQWEQPMTKTKVLKNIVLDLTGLHAFEIYKLMWLMRKETIEDYITPFIGTSIFLTLIYFYPFMIIWYLALLSSFWCAFRLRALTEHIGTNSTHVIKPVLWQRLWFLPWNAWCHYEHHERPGLPFWKLPKSRTKDSILMGELFK